MTETTAVDHRALIGELLDELKENGIQFTILAAVPDESGIVIKLEFLTHGSKNDASELLKEYIGANYQNYTWEISSPAGYKATLQLLAKPHEGLDTVRDIRKAIPFSSEYEKLAETPKEYAIRLVKEQLEAEGSRAESIYVVWFAFVLGSWKAMVSTSLTDGRYYEVTHNLAKDETYVDTYEKVRNEVHTNKENNS